jgi:IclR family KDG regulon transcriptional repressor
MAGADGTVQRVLRLLASFAEQDRWALSELSRALELPAPTTHRLLGLCKPLGFVAQDADGSYSAGPGLHRLAGRLSARLPIERTARPVLERLSARTGETSLLTLVDRPALGMYFALTAAPPDPMRYTFETHRLQPLGWGASGRALLAYMSAEEVAEVICRAEPSPLDGRPLDADELRKSLAAIRKAGHAVTHAQRTPRAWGIAVPFFGAAGEIHGNVTFTVPEFRFHRKQVPKLLTLLQAAVAEIEASLGGKG